MKFLTALVLLATCYPAVASQQAKIEYGSPSELAGTTKIFVDTGAELDLRQNIVKEIKKRLPAIVVVDSAEDAEVLLVFRAASNTVLSGVTTTPLPGTDTTTSTPNYRRVISAQAYVARFVAPDRFRMLLDFKDSRTTVFERRPSTNFARAFVKAYLKAQGSGSEVKKASR